MVHMPLQNTRLTRCTFAFLTFQQALRIHNKIYLQPKSTLTLVRGCTWSTRFARCTWELSCKWFAGEGRTAEPPVVPSTLLDHCLLLPSRHVHRLPRLMKWMEMDGNGWKWMNMDERGWKWTKVDEMDENGWKFMWGAKLWTFSVWGGGGGAEGGGLWEVRKGSTALWLFICGWTPLWQAFAM